MKVNCFILLILVSLILACKKIPGYDCTDRGDLPANSFVSADKASKISDIICNYINNDEVPCIQVTIIDSVGNTWSLASGTADLKRHESVTNENLIRLASLTKTFTATVIFKLIELGELRIDDKLITFFPDFTKAKNVTIKNLLNHSSGIKDLLTLPDIITGSSLFPDKIWDINSITGIIATKELNFTTGTGFDYSNTNYVLLGLIAEKVTKRRITELYEEYIFIPLKLDLLILVPQEATPAALIAGYDRKMLPVTGIYELNPRNTSWSSAVFSAGGLIGNSEQTAVFYHHLLTGKLLSVNSLTTMEDFGEKKDPGNDYQKYFGHGLFKFEISNQIYFGHTGLFVGADNVAAYRVKDKVTVVILSNISTFNKFGLLEEIYTEL